MLLLAKAYLYAGKPEMALTYCDELIKIQEWTVKALKVRKQLQKMLVREEEA